MKRLFVIIVPFMFISALCLYLFNFGEYNFFRQLMLISHLDFPNPINEWLSFVDSIGEHFKDVNFDYGAPQFVDVKNINDFFTNVGSFFGYLGGWFQVVINVCVSFFKSVWSFIQFIGLFVFDLFSDIYYLFVSICLLLGFPIEIFFGGI